MRPGLTLLCFTRDEAPKLLRLLDSVQGVVDEIIVVDTGSKDLSPGVAKMSGATVHQIEWPGSFAEVFNYAVPLVETEWSIRLDTDEWLLPDSGPMLRRAMQDPMAAAYNLIREDLVEDGVLNEVFQLRMWRTDHRLRFEGLIHEYVPPALMSRILGRRKIYNLDARFRHDGYLGGISSDKLRRNVELLRRELELRPGRLYYEIDLARGLLALGEEEGEAMIRSLVQQVMAEPSQEPCVADLFIVAFQLIAEGDLQGSEVDAMIERALELQGNHPALVWAVTQLERRRGRWEAVRRHLLWLDQILQSPEFVMQFGVRSDARAAVAEALAELDRERDSVSR